eukprot:TRINITY_DN8990_c0_g1_i1.p1 TRINITY_DN8990_c0_g1~~TRINITY_DN8990_c0_g1_i1.p1  ORF type:complete len:511 (+),score=111.80 TRINITY_DN8990_c0_g1_i1:89-1534(+)
MACRQIALMLVGSVHLAFGARSVVQEREALVHEHKTNASQSAMVRCPAGFPELPKFDGDVAEHCPTAQFGTLFVGCVSASGLTKKHFHRENRALCRVEMVSKTRTRDSPGGRKPARVGSVFETSVVQSDEPQWRKAFHYEFACLEAAKEMKDYVLQIQIKDEGLIFGTKTHLGYAYVDFAKFSDFADGSTEEIELQGNRAYGADERTLTAEGKVKVALKWCPFGDQECLREAAESQGLTLAGTDWTDCHDGCHNALVETLQPIYGEARHYMSAAVQAGRDEERFDDIEDHFEEEAEELDAWLEENPIDEHWKYWVRPLPPPCPPLHGGEGEPPCPEIPPLTPEQEFALLWQSKKRDRDHKEAQHQEFKRREEEAEKRAKHAFDAGKNAMDSIGEKLVEGAKNACGDVAIPFIEEAASKITKMPEGKFKVDKAQEGVEQLDAVWGSIAQFKECLLAKWKHGELLPSREVEALDAECFHGMSS